VSKLFGVGKATQEKMASLGIETCADLQTHSVGELSAAFGKFGESLYHYCRGMDDRPVNPNRISKSVSVERTFEADILNLQAASKIIGQLICELRLRLKKHEDRTVKSTFCKIKFSDFTQTTAEQQGSELSLDIIDFLFNKAFIRGNKPFRLLGIGVTFGNDTHNTANQTQLDFTLASSKNDKLNSFLKEHQGKLKPGQIRKLQS